jgi:protein-S-isoprenylcysteine O-methyltransferase Ste14
VSGAAKPGPKGDSGTKSATPRWLASVTIIGSVLAASLFMSAGRLDWRMAWAYVCVFAVTQVLVAAVAIRGNPELAAERAQRQASPAARWDRVLAGIVALWGPMATAIVSGVDMRIAGSPAMPQALQTAGLALAAAGSLLSVWAMASNPFFYGHVRIEKERGHTVVDGGPYRIVRHPGYLGAVVFNLATPLMLSSVWAFIPAGLTSGALILRTALEDRVLLEGLDGYEEYAVRVRHRLVPGLW